MNVRIMKALMLGTYCVDIRDELDVRCASREIFIGLNYQTIMCASTW